MLLLLTSQPASLSAGEPPAWVTAWLESRAKRAEQKVEKQKEQQARRDRGEAVVDLAARAKRESARAAKVSDGIEDLSRWLGDLLRRGLASIQSRQAADWGERARRMVDAQAPGIATRLLRIDALPASGEGWHDAILEHLARLHLLLEGYRRLDALPPAVAADVRTAVGFPIDQETVRSAPGVRDQWAVIGQRVVADAHDPRLRVQRTWLSGIQTGQHALILDFAYGNTPLDTSLVPGSVVDAELAFFPGNLPQRALVKERLGAASAATTLPASPTIAAAMTAYAAALARNVWLELFPMVLDSVVLTVTSAGCFACDRDGKRVPMSARFERVWHVLALSGGHPVTLTGEFNGETLDPFACVADGCFRLLIRESTPSPSTGPPPVASDPGLAASWRALSASALVGLDRRPLEVADGDDPTHALMQRLARSDPHARLLGMAAALSLSSRAGRRPAPHVEPIVPICDIDLEPECSVLQVRRLWMLLSGPFAECLGEWFGLLKDSGSRLANETLVEVLEYGRTHAPLRRSFVSVLGIRGRWLAAQNPDWAYVGGEGDRLDPEQVWESGQRNERLAALAALRRIEPERARELLVSTWGAESADDRAAFVDALKTGLSMADEPFLEAALDDRGKSVRRAAARMLSRLDESRFATRMRHRLESLVRWDGNSVSIALPVACDPAMARDGIEPKPPERTGERSWWLQQLLAAAPLALWERGEAAPDDFVRAITSTDHYESVWTGLARAAINRADERWARALLEARPERTRKQRPLPSEALIPSLLGCLSDASRDAVLLGLLRSEAGLSSSLPAFDLIHQSLQAGPVTEPLATELLERVRAVVDREIEVEAASLESTSGGDPSATVVRRGLEPDYVLHEFIKLLGSRVPVRLDPGFEVDEQSHDRSRWFYRTAAADLLKRLQFRREMYEEFGR